MQGLALATVTDLQANMEIVIYTSSSKCLKTAFLLILPMGIILSPGLFILFDTPPPVIKYVLLCYSIMSVPFVIFCMLPPWVFCLYRGFVHRPAITLSSAGIHDTSSVFGAGSIGWAELSTISIDYQGPSRWLFLVPYDPRPIWNRMSLIRRLYSKIQSPFVLSPFMVPEHLIEGSLDELATKIRTYRETNIKATSNEYEGLLCPKCQNRDVGKTTNKWILLFSLVAFVIVNNIFWVEGLLKTWQFILIIVINAILTAGFTFFRRKFRCRNCGFVWNRHAPGIKA